MKNKYKVYGKLIKNKLKYHTFVNLCNFSCYIYIAQRVSYVFKMCLIKI